MERNGRRRTQPARAPLRGVASRCSCSAGSRESADVCMLRSCMDQARGPGNGQQFERLEQAALRRPPAVCGQPRNATGGRRRSSGAGPCGSVKSPGAGREVLSRIAGCGSSGGNESGTALAQGHGACGARGIGTDSRTGARSPSLVADDTCLNAVPRSMVGTSARLRATADDAVASVNAPSRIASLQSSTITPSTNAAIARRLPMSRRTMRHTSRTSTGMCTGSHRRERRSNARVLLRRQVYSSTMPEHSFR